VLDHDHAASPEESETCFRLRWYRPPVKRILERPMGTRPRAAARTASRSLEELLRPPRDEAPARQARARRSRQAVIDAAAELFATVGYDAVGTPEIAGRAKVSVGTFYRYFTDKREVYLEVVRAYLADAYDDTLAQLTPARFVGKARREAIDDTVRILFAHVLARPGLSRSYVAMAIQDPEVGELRRAFNLVAQLRLAELIATICPRDVVADPQAMAYVVYGSALECAYGLAGVHGEVALSPTQVRAALTQLIERTLFPAR
jgi:AcrR family transcriptional regulator